MANKMFEFTGDTKGARHKNMGDWKASNGVFTLQTNVGSKNHYAAEFPIGPIKTEAWFQYDVRFENEHVFGRNLKASNVGFKMPGLGSRGNDSSMTGAHTGGKHNKAGWSGRLMTRGVRLDGNSSKPADAFAIGLYAYHLGVAESQYKYGQDFMFRADGDIINPPKRGGSGNAKGKVGDPGQWLIPVGEWCTLTLGYGMTDGHWFEAWVSTESQPTPLKVLRLEGNGFRWVGHGEREEIDTCLFQSFWGGKGDNWLPDRSAKLQYRNMVVWDSNPIGSSGAAPVATAAQVKAVETAKVHSIGSGLGGDWAARFELRGSTGTEQVQIGRGKQALTGKLEASSVNTVIEIDGIDRLGNLEMHFVNDGRTSDGRDRNVFFERLVVNSGEGGKVAVIGAEHPLLYSTAAWKDGPAEGTNSKIGHKGKMYRGGYLGFGEAVRLVTELFAPIDDEPDVSASTAKPAEAASQSVGTTRTRVDELEAQIEELKASHGQHKQQITIIQAHLNKAVQRLDAIGKAFN